MGIYFRRQKAERYIIEVDGNVIGVIGKRPYERQWEAAYLAPWGFQRAHGGTLPDIREWLAYDLGSPQPGDYAVPASPPLPAIVVPPPPNHAELEQAERDRANAIKAPVPSCFTKPQE